MPKKKKTAVVLLVSGCAALVLGLVAGFTVGTALVPVLIFVSILLNSVGIMLIRAK